MVVKSSSLLILLIQDQVWLSSSGYRVPSWNERLYMNHKWPRKAIHSVWIGKVCMCGIHWSSFLKILGKMKVDWKHVVTTAWIVKMLNLSVKTCARWWECFWSARWGTPSEPGTLGGIISSMPFHVSRIIVIEVILDFKGCKKALVFLMLVKRLVLASLMDGKAALRYEQCVDHSFQPGPQTGIVESWWLQACVYMHVWWVIYVYWQMEVNVFQKEVQIPSIGTELTTVAE